MAQIRLTRDGETYRETKTFDRKQAAHAWLEHRETELSDPEKRAQAKAVDPLLVDVIDQYIKESERAIGRTKTQCLRSIKEAPIASMKCSTIRSQDVVEFARQLRSGGRKPQTVQNYLSHLGAIFAVAKPAWGVELDRQAMKDAFVVTKRLGLTGKGGSRDRRPTADEIKLLLAHFAKKKRARASSAPMCDLIVFALFSARRQEEITTIEWRDLEEGRVMVRDMKNPGDKIGNNVWCDLPAPAVAIIERQPRKSGRIFPYNNRSISSAFTQACLFLQIDDLHFHDLRHEGVSRLFEMGLNIPHVAAVSGHRSWSSLKRYTHIRQIGDKWAWLIPEKNQTPNPL